MSSNRQRTIGAVLYPDFELLDLYGPLETFGTLGDDVRIETVAQVAGPVKSTPGPETVATWNYDNCPALDWILRHYEVLRQTTSWIRQRIV